MSHIRGQKDFFCGLLFLLVGAGALIVAQEYSFGTARRMGPGFFPVVLGAFLGLLGAFLMTRGVVGGRNAVDRLALKPAMLICGSALAFALAIKPLGLVVSVVLVVLVSSADGRNARPIPVLILALSLAAFSAGVFVYLLSQPLPLFGYLLD
jgi:hypothetical protein